MIGKIVSTISVAVLVGILFYLILNELMNY